MEPVWRRCGAGLAAVCAIVLAAGLTAVGPAGAAPGDITTFAGSLGEGVSTNIAQSPTAVVVEGPLVYTAHLWALVRVLDLRTGISRVVAGDGRIGFGGDGGPATAASLDRPRGVAVDDAGNVYIADTNNGRIRRVGTDGVITTVAGGGTSLADGVSATEAKLQPHGMAFDAAGRLYVADLNRVRRIDPAGTITTVAGSGTYGSFSGDGGPATSAGIAPSDVALDGAGNLFIADRGNNRVRKVTTDGVITTVAGTGAFLPVVDGGPATQSGLAYPDTVAVREGSIYVNGINNRSVRKIDPAGIITTIAGDGEYGDDGDGGPALAASLQAYDLDLDADGNLYMADQFNNRLRRLDPDGTIHTAAGNGTYSFGGDGGPAVKAQVSGLTRMAFDGAGNLFVADITNDVVRRIDAWGTITTVARVDFAAAGAIAFDPAGRLHIAESGRSRVVRLEPSGALTVVAGGRWGDSGDGGPATAAAMLLPSAIAFDAAGNLFIVDFDPREWYELARVRKVDPAGTITTVVGPTSPYGRFLDMCHGGDIAVDPDGRLLVTDQGGVLRVDPAGAVTRIAGGGDQGLGDGGPATRAELFCTGGVTADGAGNVYVGDPDRGRVRRIDAGGTIGTVAGGGDRSPGDGGPATSAQLFLAGGFGDLELDGDGDLYVGAGPQVVGDPGTIRRVELPARVPNPTTTSPPSTSTSTIATTTSTTSTTTTSTTTTSTTTSTTTTSTTTSTTTPTTTPTTTVPVPVKAWGLNNVGELGTGTATDSRVPVASAAPPGARGVAAGFYHSLSVNPDRTVSASGWNVFGQLGNGATRNAHTPVKVTGLAGVRQVSAGAYHSLALRDDGTVWAWGYNGFGQLGTGTTGDSLVPVRVPGVTGVVAVSAGAVHNLALKQDGTVWAWGWNALGQLGTAPGTDSRLPNPVAGLNGVSTVAAGGYHSLALRTDGSVWAWGWNQYGQLGTGSAAAAVTVPARVPGLTAVRSLAGGLLHSVAARSDGTAWAWGQNGIGQLGTGTGSDSRVPVRVTGLTGVNAVGAGAHHTVATRTDGSLWAWGWNYFGQLGIGTASDSRVPVRVPGGAGARALAGGIGHTLAA